MSKAEIWQEVSRQVAFKRYSRTVERRDYTLPNGQVSDYYVYVYNRGACALAITTDNKIVTLPQFRPGPNAILRELPGGMMDADENPHQAAQRELLEETGYAGEADGWTGTWQLDAYTQSDQNIIIVKNCKKVAEPALDDSEFGEVELMEIADFVAHVRTGQLTDAAGALLALDRLGWLTR